jgi:hypothetical protein
MNSPRDEVEKKLGPGWFTEGPVEYKYGGLVVRARTEDPAAGYPDHCGVSCVADTEVAAWRELGKAMEAYRAHPPTERAPKSLDTFAAWWDFHSRPPYETLIFPVAKLNLADPVELQAAWNRAHDALPAYWELVEVTDYYRQRKSLAPEWAAMAQAPFMHLESDHDYNHLTGWGADPISALNALTAKLAAWSPRLGVAEARTHRVHGSVPPLSAAGIASS